MTIQDVRPVPAGLDPGLDPDAEHTLVRSTPEYIAQAEAHGEAIAAVKEQILDALYVMLNEGLFEKAFGHVSCRVPGTDLYCIVGHIHDTERTLFDITADEIIVIDPDGRVAQGEMEPPGEFPIHTEILRARPDVNTVVHCHPHWPVALGATRKPFKPVTYRAGTFWRGVERCPEPRQIETPERGRLVVEHLAQNRAVILAGHGVAVVGASPAQAAVLTVDLQDACRFQMEAEWAGGAHALEDEYIAWRADAPADAETFTAPWNYYSVKWNRKNR
ncbi:class II aldolase/adducin family protein [Pseudonocardia pini]|uniref:class II aldolase/adducin family protein n=1 Tax=Pseudonocardia pini TaxID=2758030 RepID=UPI0015F0BBDE|nr:class II aldolase/adducin family protein [Pseudonocardia pini]